MSGQILFESLGAYILVFCRMGSMLFFNPLLARKNVLSSIKIALALGLTLIITPTLDVSQIESFEGLVYLFAMLKEFMVGFAAETRNVEEYAAGKLVAKKLDMIACNDVSRADIGFASDENAMTVFFAEHYQMQKRDLEKASKQEISQQLVDAIHDALNREPETEEDF